MKNKMFLGISCVAVAIAGVMFVNKLNPGKSLENDLLMENVEALALDEIKPSKACSTDFKYVNDQIRCPYCHTLLGRQGV